MPEQDAGMPGGQEVTLVNENIEVSATGKTRRGKSEAPLLEDDNTLRIWDVQVGRVPVTTPQGDVVQRELIELVESNGRPGAVLYGKDSSDNQDPLLTNANKELYIAEGRHASAQLDGVALTNTDAALQTYTQQRAIWIRVSNIHASTIAVVDVGIDYSGSAGALTAAGSIIRNYRLVPGDDTGWIGPFRVASPDVLRGKADANSVANIHFLEKIVSAE